MDEHQSSAPQAHPSTEEQDHPHACLNGYIYLSCTAFDEQTGEEVERAEVLPCRRPLSFLCTSVLLVWRYVHKNYDGTMPAAAFRLHRLLGVQPVHLRQG